MSETGFIYVLIFFLVAIAAELIISQLLKKKTYRFSDAIANLNTGMLSVAFNLFFKLALFSAYAYIYDRLSIFTTDFTILNVVLGVVIFDFIFYWNHRFSHEWNIIWGAHIIHHQSEDYNLTVALRQPIIKNFFNFAFTIPMAIIGICPEVYVVASAIDIIFQFLIHTEIIGKLPGPIEYILNTPSHHRVHHARNPEYIDKNYGGILIIWDRLFGTFKEEKETPVYGITSPLKSWNPVWANLHYYIDLYKKTHVLKNFNIKLKMLFSSPGWTPKSDVIVSPPKVSKETYQKYDKPLKPRQRRYVLTQFIITLLSFSFYIYLFHNLIFVYKLFGFGFLVLSLTNISGLLEHKRWALRLENVRLLIACLAVFYWTDLKWETVVLYPLILISVGYLYFLGWKYRAFISPNYIAG